MPVTANTFAREESTCPCSVAGPRLAPSDLSRTAI